MAKNDSSFELKAFQDSYKARYKWWFLTASVLCEIALMYNLQSVYTIQVPIQTTFHLNEISYSRILTFESIPVIFVPVVAGTLTDKYGTTILFTVGLLINYLAQAVSLYSTEIFSYWLLIAGRMLMISGFATTSVSRNKMFKNWFNSREIAKAVSACSMIDYIGIILCDIGYPNIYEAYDSLFASFLVGMIFALATAAFGVMQVCLNARLLRFENTENPENVPTEEKSYKNFPLSYWILIFCCVLGFLSYFGTKIYSSKFYQMNFHFTVGEAGFMLAAAMAASGIITFMSGVFIDRYGKVNVTAMVGGLLIILGVFGNLVFPHCFRCILAASPLVVLSLGGAIIQLIATVGTLRLVKTESLGLGLSLYNVLMSIGLFFYPLIGGYISEKTINDHGYFWVFFMNLMLGVLAFALAVWLSIADKNGGKQLSAVLDSARSSMAIVPDGGTYIINGPNGIEEYDSAASMQAALLVNEEDISSR